MDDTNRPHALTGAAIGTFDGLHRGHTAVLDSLKEVSAERGLLPLAITFDRHPLSLIAPERAPLAITTIGRKSELIRKAGVSPVVLPFDEKMRETTAADWMGMLHDRFGVRLLVVGYDNTFGSDGLSLSVADYRKIGEEKGIEVVEAPVVPGISSSAVRKAVTSGDLAEASDMLGRFFSLPGVVVEGNKLGRTIGFPTANVLPDPGILVPGNGVYAATVSVDGGAKIPAVVNVGVRPTVRRGENLTIEAHLIDWHGDIYGMAVSLDFIGRLRDEQMFNSIDALRRQIEKDTSKAKLFIAEAMKARK